MSEVSQGQTQPLFGQEHVRRYLETEGEVGHDWNGVSTLILTTKGRSSGELRMTPLIYGEAGDSFVVVASQGGAPTHPAWYLNLQADGSAEVQVRDRRRRVQARTAEGPERERLWAIMARIWPAYDEYQQRTNRRIPIVVLDPD